MNAAGIIVMVFLVAGVTVWFFADWDHSRRVEYLTNEERMATLGRVVEFAQTLGEQQ